MGGFLTAFRDDFLKLPLLVFPIFSGAVSEEVDVDNVSTQWRLMDAHVWTLAVEALDEKKDQ
jgi:hypothetical protein